MKRVSFSLPGVLVLIMATLVFSAVFAEEIELKSGQTIEAKIIEKTNEYVKVDFYGTTLTYYLSEIKRIGGESLSTSLAESPRESSASASTATLSPQDIFKKVSEAVVRVSAKKPDGQSSASGFIIRSDGMVVTNYHVIDRATEITVRLKDGKAFTAVSVAFYDPIRDLAIITIDTQGLPVVELGDSRDATVGDTIYAIGNPLGFDYSLSNGIVSGIRVQGGNATIQFTAPISHGNSGGPLIDVHGRAIGVNVATQPDAQNINFSIVINEVKPFIGRGRRMSLREVAENGPLLFEYYMAAVDAVSKGNLSQGIQFATKGIQLNPDADLFYALRAGGYISLADQALARGDQTNFSANINLGIADANKALEINPMMYMAYGILGACYGGMKDFERTLSSMSKAIEVQPQYGEGYANRASSYYFLKRYDSAWEDVRKAQALGYEVTQAFLDELRRVTGVER